MGTTGTEGAVPKFGLGEIFLLFGHTKNPVGFLSYYIWLNSLLINEEFMM